MIQHFEKVEVEKLPLPTTKALLPVDKHGEFLKKARVNPINLHVRWYDMTVLAMERLETRMKRGDITDESLAVYLKLMKEVFSFQKSLITEGPVKINAATDSRIQQSG